MWLTVYPCDCFWVLGSLRELEVFPVHPSKSYLGTSNTAKLLLAHLDSAGLCLESSWTACIVFCGVCCTSVMLDCLISD